MASSNQSGFDQYKFKPICFLFCLVIGVAVWFYGINTGIAATQSTVPAEVATLVEKLTDDNSIVRANAAFELGLLRTKAASAVPDLLFLLKDRKLLVWKVPVTVNTVNTIREDTSPGWEATKALIKIGGVKPFVRGLKSEDPEIVSSVLLRLRELFSHQGKVLAEMKKDQIVDSLIRSLVPIIVDISKTSKESEQDNLRKKAVGTLGYILFPHESMQDNVKKLYAPGGKIQTEVIESSIPVLTSILLSNEESESLRVSSATTLGKIRSKTAIQPLTTTLSDQSVRLRSISARSLGWIKHRSAIPSLIKALRDPEDVVRDQACNSLGYIGDNSAVPALIEAARNNRCKWVFISLGKLGDKRATPVLIEALKKRKGSNSGSPALALGEIKDPASVPALIEAAEAGNGNAVEALGKIGDLRAVNILIDLIKQRKFVVKASQALGEMRDDRGVSVLILYLDQWLHVKPISLSDINAIESACTALAKIGGESAFRYLVDLLSVRHMRRFAVEGLKILTGKNLGHDVKAWKKYKYQP